MSLALLSLNQYGYDGGMEHPRRRLDTASRRAEILEAARSLYAENSYTDVTTAQVAAASSASQALVFHYFGSKADLFAAVLEDDFALLRAAQRTAVDALPQGSPVRDRVRASLEVFLDHVAARPGAWLGAAEEPAPALDVRTRARSEWVQLLAELLGVRDWPRHTFALWGFIGFVHGASREWASAGAPANRRQALVDAALGSLEGALGDWAV